MEDDEVKAWKLDRNGLIVLPGISWEEFEEAWSVVVGVQRRGLFFLGDAILAGENFFGEEFAQILGDQYRPETVRNAKWVSSRIDPPRRRPDDLSWSVHQALASLDPAEQDAMMQRAVEEKWSTQKTKEAVRLFKEEKAGYPSNGGQGDEQPPPEEKEPPDDGEEEPEDQEDDGKESDPSTHPLFTSPAPPDAPPTIRSCIETLRKLGARHAGEGIEYAEGEEIRDRLRKVFDIPDVFFDPIDDIKSAISLLPKQWTIRITGSGREDEMPLWECDARCGDRMAIATSASITMAIVESALAARISEPEQEAA